MEGGKDGGEIGGPVCVDVIDWRDQFNAPLSTLSARFSPLRILFSTGNRTEPTQILSRLAGNSHLRHNRPLAVVVRGLVIAVVDMVGDASLGKSLAQVLG